MKPRLTEKIILAKLRERVEKKLKNTNSVSEVVHEIDVFKEELFMQANELSLAEQRTSKSLKEYEQLFNLAPVSYIVLDKDGVIMDLNQTAVNLFGKPKHKIKGSPLSIFINGVSKQDDYYRHRNKIDKSNNSDRIDSEIRGSGERIVSVQIETIIVYDENSKFKHFLSTLTDISVKKEQERVLELAILKEKEISELKSRFVSMASHEFRTPLSAISTSTDLLRIYFKNKDVTNIEKHFQRITSAVGSLTEILNDFLSLDMLEHNELKVKNEKVDVISFTNKVMEEVNVILKQGQVIEQNIQGLVKVKTDKKIFKSILVNLLINASKYSSAGSKIELTINVTKEMISIKVKDSGIGIPYKDQSKIFTRLFRAKNAEMITGTGLGLNIIRNYISLLQGKISFTSIENVGTVFSVEIPAEA